MNALLGSPEDVTPTGPLRRIGLRVFVLAECTSTNDVALSEWEAPRDGDVIFSEHQTRGRGRLGRDWVAPRGASVLCSVRLLVARDRTPWARLSLAAGIGVHEAIRQATNVPATLKWPNDVVVGSRKIAGVLIETSPRAGGITLVTVGVGINCLQHRGHFPSELAESATSLDLESDQPIDRRGVARRLIASLDRWLDPQVLEDRRHLREQWCRRGQTIGSRVRLRSHGKVYAGVVVDLDSDAGILVALDEGAQRLFCPLTTSTVG